MRYDHGRFHEIKRSDSQRPRGDPVDAIAEDVNQNIWALTIAGHLLRVTNQIAKEVTEVTSAIVNNPVFLYPITMVASGFLRDVASFAHYPQWKCRRNSAEGA